MRTANRALTRFFRANDGHVAIEEEPIGQGVIAVTGLVDAADDGIIDFGRNSVGADGLVKGDGW